MTQPRPCSGCGARGPCLPGCTCAKCQDEYAYDEWRYQHPDDYLAWRGHNGFDAGHWECAGCGQLMVPFGKLQLPNPHLLAAPDCPEEKLDLGDGTGICWTCYEYGH